MNPNNRPNVLLLLSDEHSHRFLGKNQKNGEDVLTPNLDGLIDRGTWFEDAYCQMPLCTPSRISFLTGKEVRKSGGWNNADVLRPGLKTLPGEFSSAGYETCLVGKMHLGGTRQFAGFRHRPYGDLTGKCGHQYEPITDLNAAQEMRARTAFTGKTGIPESLIQDRIVEQETVSWIRNHSEENPDKPWFVCSSFSRPHFPLTAPPRWIDHYREKGVSKPFAPDSGDAYAHPMSRGMRDKFQVSEIDGSEMMNARSAYFSCVSYLDEVIGDLFGSLERTGQLENTIIVYISDHGEMAGEHGTWWKHGWFEACTRVPFIISLPEQRKTGKSLKTDCPVALLDLFPTLCELCGINIPRDLDGRSLATVWKGQSLEEIPVFSDALTSRWGEGTEFRSVRYKNCKYVLFKSADPLFFDLANDPQEQKNLIKRGIPARLRKTFEDMEAYAKKTIDFDQAKKERAERDGDLSSLYELKLGKGSPGDYLNCFILPDGRVIHGDEILYNPLVIASDYKKTFDLN